MALVMLAVGLAAPLFDVLENLISFVVLARPHDIARPVALMYSASALVTSCCFALTYAWVPVGLIAAAVLRRGGRRAME